MKIIINPKRIKLDEIFKVWNKTKSIIIVANDPTVPGIIFILPIPNIVTNKELNVLIIFVYWNYNFTGNSFFFSY